MHAVIDLRGCHDFQERGIATYSQNIAISVARTGRLKCSFLVHKDRPRLAREPELLQLGSFIYYEDLVYHGLDRCDVYLMTSVIHGLEYDGDFERYAIPPTIAAHRPILSAILYDLIPWLYRDIYLTDPTTRRRYVVAASVLRSLDHLFAISGTSVEDASRLLRISRQAISIIYGGVESHTRLDKTALIERVQRTDVVYIGGDDFRKNMARLVAGFAHFKLRRSESPLKLVIVGRLSDETRRALHLAMRTIHGLDRASVELTGMIGREALLSRLARARACVFPSLYEGLGLPVLEAYSMGLPVFGSESSSVGSLLHPACQFDPTQEAEIATAFEAINDSESTLRASVRFGESIVANFSWKAAAESIVTTVTMLSLRHQSIKPRKQSKIVAVVGTAEPDNSGVAIFNSRAFSRSRKSLVLFSDMRNEETARLKLKHFKIWNPCSLAVAPMSYLADFITRAKCELAVYVLSNSAHSVAALEALQQHPMEGPDAAIYLHDVRVTGLLSSFFRGDTQRLTKEFAAHYPSFGSNDPASILAPGSPIMGVRLLMSLVGDRTVIVNSDRARQLLEAELGEDNVRTVVLFHPILPSAAFDDVGVERGESLVIGHFGVVGHAKRPDLLIEAARLIAAERKVTLIFAGYDLDFLAGSPLPPFVQLFHNPPESELRRIMNMVDVAAQPREPDHGEASGVIHQLISLGKRPLTTAGTYADSLGDLVVPISPGASAGVWANSILQASCGTETKPTHRAPSVEDFGAAFDDAIDRIIVADKRWRSFIGIATPHYTRSSA